MKNHKISMKKHHKETLKQIAKYKMRIIHKTTRIVPHKQIPQQMIQIHNKLIPIKVGKFQLIKNKLLSTQNLRFKGYTL